jgi:hypothetical protein
VTDVTLVSVMGDTPSAVRGLQDGCHLVPMKP